MMFAWFVVGVVVGAFATIGVAVNSPYWKDPRKSYLTRRQRYIARLSSATYTYEQEALLRAIKLLDDGERARLRYEQGKVVLPPEVAAELEDLGIR